jgi:ATP-dependent RNA helicase DDX41
MARMKRDEARSGTQGGEEGAVGSEEDEAGADVTADMHAADVAAALVEFVPLRADGGSSSSSDLGPLPRHGSSWTPPAWLAGPEAAAASLVLAKGLGIILRSTLPLVLMPRFVDARLPGPLLARLADDGIHRPSAIQLSAIPAALAGQDIIGIASTGSGKTLVFVLPAILRAAEMSVRAPVAPSDGPFALLLAPSRELARQTQLLVDRYGAHVAINAAGERGIRSMLAIGGVPLAPQRTALTEGCHVVVGTPGRIIGLLRDGSMSLDDCVLLALDEADRLIDMGFEDDMRTIMRAFRHPHQTLLFSATMPPRIQAFARSALSDPFEVNVGRAGAASLNVLQDVMYVPDDDKLKALDSVIKATPPPVLIFASSPDRIDDIHEHLLLKGISTVAIHGQKTQRDRMDAMDRYRDGTANVLVATDVASKGLDFPKIEHVINFDMPREIENYIHRIGRTGRGGNTGLATTFINRTSTEDILRDLKALLVEAKQKVPRVLQALRDPEGPAAAFDPSAQCDYCSGLGHVALHCPKMERDASVKARAFRDEFRD